MKKKAHYNKIEPLLAAAMHADRIDAGRSLRRIKHLRTKGEKPDQIKILLTNIETRLKHSAQKREWRKTHVPSVSYHPALPITAKKDDIIAAITDHPVVIISGETGSGKTTQIPKFCLAAGRGISGMIGCTQPRRIAATTVSHRIADELRGNVGESVGYKIRFKEKTGPNTFIKIMTDGILLAETQNDPYLNTYDTIIVDEAHERSLNIDFILGILKDLVAKRKDLKLIITSATIDTEKFSKAFGNAPVIEVSGRMYPVDTRYLPGPEGEPGNADLTYIESAVTTVDMLQREGSKGDILVFMPTEQDIRECCDLVSGRKYKNVAVLPLYARLPSNEQKRVFRRFDGRKIIVATNVAETSITIPGIKYVVDSGLARMSRYTPKYRITALPIVPISRSSADQRKGRCGRVEDGICIRLYAEEDYQNRPLFTKPEILRSNLAEVILRMIYLKLGDIEKFPFIDQPADKSIKDGFNLLLELDAIKQAKKPSGILKKRLRGNKNRQKNGGFFLTTIGRLMAKLPIDPRLSKMIIEAQERGCLEEITVIAAALSVQDPRERPAEKEQAADQAQAIFVDPQSDFITLLNIWKRYAEAAGRKKSTTKLKKFCKSHYLSFRRMREWLDIHNQISFILKENGLKEKLALFTENESRKDTFSARYTAIHKSILSGFLSNIARQKEKQYFKAARDKDVMLFPGSGLFKKPGPWIVAAQFVETSRLFARIAATIDAEWLEEIGGDQCRRTHRDPHWEKTRGEVVATEQVSLYGLIIVPGRPVSYGVIDPGEAAQIFIRQALVTGEIKPVFGFLKHNLDLIEEIRNMEDKFRRRDILIHEEEIADFYSRNLAQVYDIRTLKRSIKQRGSDDYLKLKREDLLRYAPDPDDIDLFPDQVRLGSRTFECLYQFGPEKHDDGLTVKIPSVDVPGVDKSKMDWLVPGMVKEKIAALIKGLPKSYRKQLVPVSSTVDVILAEMPTQNTPLIVFLSSFIYKHFGVDVPSSAWPLDNLPDHLKMRIEITDAQNKVIHQGRDPSLLDQSVPEYTATREYNRLKQTWEKTGIQTWDLGDIPETVILKGKKSGKWITYPGLETDGKEINLRLFPDREQARKSHRRGVVAIYARKFSQDLKFLKHNLKLPRGTDQTAQYFGGCKTVEQRIFNNTVHRIFGLDIRQQSDYLQQEEIFATTGIHTRGQKKLQKIVSVLNAHHEARTVIYHLETANSRNIHIQSFLEKLRDDLSNLLPDTFIDLYDEPRLVHIPRYIKAVAVRAQRGVVNLEKDRQRDNKIRILNHALKTLISTLSDSASKEKREAVEDLFWYIQEYKVSVFAQELKTAVPVSWEKLQQKIKDIERII